MGSFLLIEKLGWVAKKLGWVSEEFRSRNFLFLARLNCRCQEESLVVLVEIAVGGSGYSLSDLSESQRGFEGESGATSHGKKARMYKK